jgi:hypothetical protein
MREGLLKYIASGGAGLFSPLTPALSPLRGEGDKYLFPFNRQHGWCEGLNTYMAADLVRVIMFKSKPNPTCEMHGPSRADFFRLKIHGAPGILGIGS